MGEYYSWVNVDKRELIVPEVFGSGLKFYQNSVKGVPVNRALRTLLADRWKGDRVIFLGDETWPVEEPVPPLYWELERQTRDYEELLDMEQLLWDRYLDVSALFKESEEGARKDIEEYLWEWENNCATLVPFHIDPEDPYRGLFVMNFQAFRYTLNHSKKLYFEEASIELLWEGEELTGYYDPITFLMSYGSRRPNPGPWLGDIVGVSDTIPEGYRPLEPFAID